jgi:hypothetical protein
MPEPPAAEPDLFPPPFPERPYHLDLCPGCGHVLGVHADSFGCIHGWTYDADGFAVTEGCECPLTLAFHHHPPGEGDL